MKRNYKKLALIMAIMLFTLSIASSGFAANTVAKLEAYYRNIKVYKNGMQVQFTHEPFIVNGTTYVPLRDMSEMLDKDVTWDGTTYSIGINDKPGSNINDLYTQIYNYQLTIAQLEKKVKDLEEQTKKPTTTSISAMEKQLNKDHGKYEKIDFDIDLSESKSKITVKIYVDLDVDYSRWDSLTTKKIESYLQGIVDDISESFSDSTISGYIEDSDAKSKLISFTVNNKGKVSTSKSSGSSDIDDMEYDLDKYYATTKNGIESVEFYKSGSKLYLNLYVYKSTWNGLKTSKQEEILENMYNDIDEYFSETIVGEIMNESDGKHLSYFDYSSKGVVTID